MPEKRYRIVKARPDAERRIEDFIEGFNQPTYRGMRISGQRVATWTEVDPVWWSRSGFQRRLHRCPRHVRHTHRNFAVK